MFHPLHSYPRSILQFQLLWEDIAYYRDIPSKHYSYSFVSTRSARHRARTEFSFLHRHSFTTTHFPFFTFTSLVRSIYVTSYQLIIGINCIARLDASPLNRAREKSHSKSRVVHSNSLDPFILYISLPVGHLTFDIRTTYRKLICLLSYLSSFLDTILLDDTICASS